MAVLTMAAFLTGMGSMNISKYTAGKTLVVTFQSDRRCGGRLKEQLQLTTLLLRLQGLDPRTIRL